MGYTAGEDYDYNIQVVVGLEVDDLFGEEIGERVQGLVAEGIPVKSRPGREGKRRIVNVSPAVLTCAFDCLCFRSNICRG